MIRRPQVDPELDLVLERDLDVSPERVWRAWTEPELLVQWFTPAPWQTVACEIDLRPGGVFRTVMRSPEGEEFPSQGCYLEVVPNRKLAWTDALEGEFRPTSMEPGKDCPFLFTGTVLLEPRGSGTAYTAIAMHSDAAAAGQHREMGFLEGWGAALDQLVSLAKTF